MGHPRNETHRVRKEEVLKIERRQGKDYGAFKQII
jgi:hypothetical protein